MLPAWISLDPPPPPRSPSRRSTDIARKSSSPITTCSEEGVGWGGLSYQAGNRRSRTPHHSRYQSGFPNTYFGLAAMNKPRKSISGRYSINILSPSYYSNRLASIQITEKTASLAGTNQIGERNLTVLYTVRWKTFTLRSSVSSRGGLSAGSIKSYG